MDELIKKAHVLVEALPYIKAFAGKTIVIKYGGKAMTDPVLKEGFATDVVLLKYVGLNPVIVHGGGPQIDQMLKRLAIEPKFRQGVRVTDAATMEIVEMVLGGTINKEIAALITRHGTKAVGLSGKDGGLIQAKPFTKADWTKKLGTDLGSLADHEDYGLVGDVLSINPSLLYTLQGSQVIPVIASSRFSGVVSVLFGVIVLIAPGAGALGLVWAIAAYSIVFGISFVALAFRLKNHRHEAAAA